MEDQENGSYPKKRPHRGEWPFQEKYNKKNTFIRKRSFQQESHMEDEEFIQKDSPVLARRSPSMKNVIQVRIPIGLDIYIPIKSLSKAYKDWKQEYNLDKVQMKSVEICSV